MLHFTSFFIFVDYLYCKIIPNFIFLFFINKINYLTIKINSKNNKLSVKYALLYFTIFNVFDVFVYSINHNIFNFYSK